MARLPRPLVAAVVLVVALLAALSAWILLQPPRNAPESAPNSIGDASGALARSTPAGDATEDPEGPSRDTVGLPEREHVAPGEPLGEDEPRTLAPFRARLVDARTGAGVPEYRVRIEAGARSETLTSDADGEVTGEQRFAAGALTVHFCEQEEAPDLVQSSRERREAAAAVPRSVVLEFDPNSPSPRELPVPVGPTYHLSVEPPGLVESVGLRAILMSANRSKAFDKAYASVHPGLRAWVRFAATADQLGFGPPWSMQVDSNDGLWRGTVAIPEIVPVDPQTRRVELHACGRVHGVLTDQDGTALPQEAVQLWPEGGSFSDPANRPTVCFTDGEGGFDAPGLRPAKYELKVEAVGFEALALSFDVLAGATLEKNPALTRLARLGPVRGVVRSQSGRSHGPCSLLLFAETTPRQMTHHDLSWQDGERGQFARIDLPDLTVGEYAIEVRLDTLLRVEPHRIEFSTSREDLEFVIQDLEPRVDLGFRVQDPGSGEALEHFRVALDWTEPNGEARHTYASTKDGLLWHRGFPAETDFEFCVDDVPDHAPSWGRGRSGGFGEQFSTVDVVRGWGTELRVEDEDGAPVPGARVAFGGREVGSTDAEGHLRVVLEERPLELVVEAEGYEFSPKSPVSADLHALRDQEPKLRVVLRRSDVPR